MSLAHSLTCGALGGAPAASHEEITMQSTIRVFKLDEVKKGTSKKTGSPYEIHTAQAALIDDVGNIDTVGVLDIPPALRGQVVPGDFRGTFALKTNFTNGRIEAVLTGLASMPPAKPPAPAAPPAPSK